MRRSLLNTAFSRLLTQTQNQGPVNPEWTQLALQRNLAYTPLQVAVYTAAFQGAMAAICIPDGAFITDPVTGDYANHAAIAAAFAQAVDTAWTAAPVANSYDLSVISTMATQIFAPHNVGPLGVAPINTQANWTIAATALVAAAKQGDTNFALQNITPSAGNVAANRAYGSGTATTAGQATITVIAALKLIAKGSGIFKFDFKALWTALTAADVGTLTVKVFTDAVAGVPLTLGNNGAIGFGANGVAQPGNVAVANNGMFTANAGAGLTIAGANAGITYDTSAITEGTGAAAAILSATGITGTALPAAAESPFPVGTTCLVTFSLTNSVAARATGNITGSLIEL